MSKETEAIISAYNQQSQYVKELEMKIESYQKYSRIRQSKGKTNDPKKKYFVKVFMHSLGGLIMKKQLTIAEQRVMFSILPFVEKESNFITNGKGERINEEEMIRLCNMDRRTLDNAMKLLGEKDILFKIKKNNKVSFMVNSQYYYVGSDENIWATTEEAKELLNPEKVVK